MKAIRIHEPTGISGLVFEEVPDAKPMACDVLVKVAACGITHNELDYPIWTCRAGHQRTSIIPGARGVGGRRRAGTRDGRDRRRRRGVRADRPVRDGAAAEYVAVEARNMAPKPQTVDHVHAAAVPRAGLTAWQALFDHGKLAKGQTVVIHGAGGAVGSTAVQLARWAGAEVIGTGRSHSRPLVTELGADRFVALDADRLEDVAGQADLVFDTIGGEVLARSPALLRPGGTLVSVQRGRAAARHPGRHQDGRLHPGVQPRSADRARPPGRRGAPAPPGRRGVPARASSRGVPREGGRRIPGRIVLQP